MQKETKFAVIAQGATLESDLALGIPAEEYSFWLFKPGRALMYFESKIPLNR